MKTVPYLINRPYTAEWINVRSGRTFRIIVFRPGANGSGLRPLHVSIHGGAFLGGMPEYNAELCEQICRKTGAVVVSISYRYAPKYHFPAAIDDVDEIFSYLREHAKDKYGADPCLMSVSGLSAGGNLALAAAQQDACHAPSPTSFKAAVTMYASIDLRLKPEEKPKPEGFPTRDPMQVFMPLFDAYAGPVRAENMDNPRLNPVIASLDKLPENMLVIIPTMDILLHEQLTFIQRVQHEASKNPRYSHQRYESILLENQIHGGVELPSATEGMRLAKERCFNATIDFLNDIHRKHDFLNEAT